MKYTFTFIAALLGLSAIAQMETYTYKRRLQKAEQPGFYAIPLIPELTAKMKSGMNDVRLYNTDQNDTTELPYIFEWLGDKTETVAVPFERINDTYNQKCCSYVTLKLNEKKAINQVRLEVEEPEFDKRVMIEGSNDNKEWFTIREHMRIVSFRGESESYSYTTLNFESTEYSYYRLKLDDDGSDKITILDAYAFITLEKPGTYSALQSKMLKQTEDKKLKTSELIIEMPHRYLLSYMNIKAKGQDFYRNINVYASAGTYPTAKGEQESWYLISSAVLSSDENTAVELNNVSADRIKIEVINHDNEPIPITDVKLFGEQCRLVAKLPVTELAYIAYGKANDAPPSYDLVHFKEKIPATLTDVFYDAEELSSSPAPVQEPFMKSKGWLWVVMGAVILIIGYFALSMIRKEQKYKAE